MTNLDIIPEEKLREILLLQEAQATLARREEAKDKFMSFAHHVYDDFIEGNHHRVIAEKLELVAQGKLKRLIINMPPRHSKSAPRPVIAAPTPAAKYSPFLLVSHLPAA